MELPGKLRGWVRAVAEEIDEQLGFLARRGEKRREAIEEIIERHLVDLICMMSPPAPDPAAQFSLAVQVRDMSREIADLKGDVREVIAKLDQVPDQMRELVRELQVLVERFMEELVRRMVDMVRELMQQVFSESAEGRFSPLPPSPRSSRRPPV